MQTRVEIFGMTDVVTAPLIFQDIDEMMHSKTSYTFFADMSVTQYMETAPFALPACHP
jgi:hypothetical protein